MSEPRVFVMVTLSGKVWPATLETEEGAPEKVSASGFTTIRFPCVEVTEPTVTE